MKPAVVKQLAAEVVEAVRLHVAGEILKHARALDTTDALLADALARIETLEAEVDRLKGLRRVA